MFVVTVTVELTGALVSLVGCPRLLLVHRLRKYGADGSPLPGSVHTIFPLSSSPYHAQGAPCGAVVGLLKYGASDANGTV